MNIRKRLVDAASLTVLVILAPILLAEAGLRRLRRL